MERTPEAFVADLNNLMQEYGLVVSYDTHGLRLVEWKAAAEQYRTLHIETMNEPFVGEMRLEPTKVDTEPVYKPVLLACPGCGEEDCFTTAEAYPDTFSIDVRATQTYIPHELYEYVAGDATIRVRCDNCDCCFTIDGDAHVSDVDNPHEEGFCTCGDCGLVTWSEPNITCPRCKRGSLQESDNAEN